MSKRSNHYKGYILLEGLFALGLLCLIVGSYISFNIFLMRKNRQTQDQLLLHRVLYEEMKRYENHGGRLQQELHTENHTYQLQLYKNEHKLIEVRISDGKEKIILKKESTRK